MITDNESKGFVRNLAGYLKSDKSGIESERMLNGAKINNGMVAWLTQATFVVKGFDNATIDSIISILKKMYYDTDVTISKWNSIRSLYRIYIANHYLKSKSALLRKVGVLEEQEMKKIAELFYELSDQFITEHLGHIRLGVQCF